MVSMSTIVIRSLQREVYEDSQLQHVLHAVEPFFLLGEPLRGAERAAREGLAALRAVDELDALAQASEDDGMLADEVAGADRKNPYLLFRALADDAFAARDPGLVEIAL